MIHESTTSSFSIESSRVPHQPPAAVILMHWFLMWLLFNEKQASLALLSYYRVIDLRWRMSLVEVNSFTQVINPFNQILKPPRLPSLANMISLALFPSLSNHLIGCLLIWLSSDSMYHLIIFYWLSFTHHLSAINYSFRNEYLPMQWHLKV